MMQKFLVRYAIVLLMLLPARFVFATDKPEWTTPLAPFQIADNLYYVGSQDLASYLVVTPQGDILINSNLESSPALIEKSIQQLGFKFTDVKILLIAHAHFDHDAGSAAILKGNRREIHGHGRRCPGCRERWA